MQSHAWRSISCGAMLTSIVATTSGLYALTGTNAVFPRHGRDGGESWIHESADMPGAWQNLVATYDTLYAVDAKRQLYRYCPPPNGEVPWEPVSEYADGYWGNYGHVFKSEASTNSLYYLADKTWKRVGDALDSMVIGRKYILGIRNATPYALIAMTTVQVNISQPNSSTALLHDVPLPCRRQKILWLSLILQQLGMLWIPYLQRIVEISTENLLFSPFPTPHPGLKLLSEKSLLRSHCNPESPP